jgi:hypothetical protein
MSLLSSIGRIVPTVGSILGQLFTSIADKNQVSVVRFSFNVDPVAGNDVEPGFNADFRLIGEHCYLCNRGKEDEGLFIDVAEKGNMEGETVAVMSLDKFDVTPLFENCAENNVDNFGLTAFKVETNVPLASDANAMTTCATLSASGSKIPADGQIYKLGSYLKVNFEGSDVVISSKDLQYPIITVRSLIVHGSSDLKASVYDFDGEGKAAVRIPVATSFNQNDTVDIDIVCKVGEAQKIFSECSKLKGMGKITADEEKLLKAAVVLNK